jgi:ribosomal subunit interface protein
VKIEIRAIGIAISESLQNYIRRRVGFSLRRFRKELDGVLVRLRDENGPRGGADKRYRVGVRLIPDGKVWVEQSDSDIYNAIRRASARLGHSLAEELKRRKESHRGRESMRKPLLIQLGVHWAKSQN